jgi:hypothetical protein
MRPTDPRITSSLAIAAIAVWLGGLLALGAIAAPAVFSIVPAPWSADAMTVVFVRFDRVAMSSAGVVLVVEAVRARMPEVVGRLDIARVTTAVLASALAILEGVWLSPKIVHLHRAGAIRGLGELGLELESTHHLAELCGKVQAALLLGLLAMHVFTAARPKVGSS